MCVCVCVLLRVVSVWLSYLLHVLPSSFIHNRFILQDLDELHIFVSSDIAKILQQKIDELMEKTHTQSLTSKI